MYQAQIVTYNSAECIVACVDSLLSQELPPTRIVILDNASRDDTAAVLAERVAPLVQSHPASIEFVTLVSDANIGYAAGHNRCLQRALEAHHGPNGGRPLPCAWVLTLNPDVVLARHYASMAISRARESARDDIRVAGVSGKLIRTTSSDGASSPRHGAAPPARNIIDSAGLRMGPFLHARDRGGGEDDEGQFGTPGPVWGICGAAALYNLAMLRELAERGPVFDPTFFIYKEDVDLCWRARLLGWSFCYEPLAVAHHARGWKPHGSPATATAAHSFANQIAIASKYSAPRRPFFWVCLLVESVRWLILAMRNPDAATQAWRLILEHADWNSRQRRLWLDADTASRPGATPAPPPDSNPFDPAHPLGLSDMADPASPADLADMTDVTALTSPADPSGPRSGPTRPSDGTQTSCPANPAAKRSVSVIMVTYNSAQVLPACLSALERCDGAGDLELIIIDNASTDDTWRLVQSYRAKSQTGPSLRESTNGGSPPFAHIVTARLEENRGYAFANNRGLANASGDVLLLLNPDTEVSPAAISSCADRLRNSGNGLGPVTDPAIRNVNTAGTVSTHAPVTAIGADRRIGVVGCRLRLPDGRLDRACRRSFPTLWNSFARLSGLSLLFPKSRLFAGYNLTYLPDNANYAVDCVSGAFLMTSRDVYESVGGLDEDYFMYGEDIDWCYRIRAAGYQVWYEGDVVTVHHKGGNGGKRSIESLYHFYNTMLIYYRKHHADRYPGWVASLLSLVLQGLYAGHAGIAGMQAKKQRAHHVP